MVDRPGDLLIREASVAEAEAVAAVLRRSITELCVAEHGNATAVIDAWLANKTAESVGEWIADPKQTLLVAVIDREIAGVAAASRFSQVLLN
ncbi:MAG: GNAT family N-acetyltransferase, partial [Proteobacteria bacterium]